MYTVMTLIEQASFLILIEASNGRYRTHHSALERHLDGRRAAFVPVSRQSHCSHGGDLASDVT